MLTARAVFENLMVRSLSKLAARQATLDSLDVSAAESGNCLRQKLLNIQDKNSVGVSGQIFDLSTGR